MYDNYCFAACKGNTLLYECFMFRGHHFRLYPDGMITAADSNDVEVAARLAR